MLYRVLLLSIISTLVGCSLTKPMPTPTIAKYTLNQMSPISKIPNNSQKDLVVSSMKSNVGYNTTDMLYMTEPFRLQAFAKNAWNAAPASMLQALLIDSLRNSHLFRVVLSAPSTAQTEYRLDTTLLKLQQEIFGARAHIRLTVDASVIKTRTNAVIASQRFEAVVPTAANPKDGVIAANRAALQVLDQLVRFTDESTH